MAGNVKKCRVLDEERVHAGTSFMTERMYLRSVCKFGRKLNEIGVTLLNGINCIEWDLDVSMVLTMNKQYNGLSEIIC